MKKLVLATALVGAMSASVSTVAQAETSASVAVANTYLWRGIDVSAGTAAVSGDLTYSNNGFTAQVWATSMNSDLGAEIDLILGYAKEFDNGFSLDVGYIGYLFPKDDIEVGDINEVYVGGSYGAFSVYHYEDFSSDDGEAFIGDTDNRYTTLAVGVDKFSALVGFDYGDVGYTHIDLGYAFNDNLSFTLSKIVENDDDYVGDDDTKFVISYGISF